MIKKYKIGDVIEAYQEGFFHALFKVKPTKKIIFRIGWIDTHEWGVCYRQNAFSSGVGEKDIIRKIEE